MNNANDTGGYLGTGFAFLTTAPFILLLLFWLITAGVAGGIATFRNRSGWGFFLVTFFFLGPFGIMAALLATRGELDRPPLRVRVIPRTSTGTLKVGDRVRAIEEGDESEDRVGVIEQITDDDDGYNFLVTFIGDPDTYTFTADELRVVHATPQKATAHRPKGTPSGKHTQRSDDGPKT